MEETYEKAYTEVVELLKYFKKESVEKIPKEKLDLYMSKKDKSYNYKVDTSKSFEEQKMLDKTKAIFANIYRDYWADDYEREKIKQKEEKEKKYLENLESSMKIDCNFDDIFNNKVKESNKDDKNNIVVLDNKKGFFGRLFENIRKIFSK